MKTNLWSALALVLIAVLVLTACAKPAETVSPTTTQPPAATTRAPAATAPAPAPTAPAPAGAQQYGGTLKIRFSISPRNLLPPMAATYLYAAATHDSLIAIDPNGDMIPWLATDWKLSPDNKSLTLNLRKGVKFHDGTDFTADAVKWNIDMRKKALLGDYVDLTSVDIVDDYTVRLNLSKFQNTLLVTLTNLGGFMASPTPYEKNGKDWAMWNPSGTGPFRFVKYDKDTLYKMERFDGYWQQGKPYLDGIEVHLIADQTTAAIAFERGDVDIIAQADAKTGDDLKARGFLSLPVTPDSVMALLPDSANATSPFANKKVREALEHAVDREGIVKALGYGYYEPSYQLAPSYSYAYRKDLAGRKYDTAKAKQLLSEAGFPDGFKTTLYTRNTSSREVLVATITNLKAAGIDATLQPVDIGRFGQIETGGWNNAVLYQVFWNEPDWVFRQYGRLSGTSASKSMLRPAGTQELLDKAIATPDLKERNTLSQQLVKAIYDDATVAPLWAYQFASLYQKKVHNPEWIQTTMVKKWWSPADAWMSK